MEFTKTVLGPGPQPNLQRVPDGFQRVPANAFDNGFKELVVLYRASLHLHGFRNGFQRVPDGFHGFRQNVIFAMCIRDKSNHIGHNFRPHLDQAPARMQITCLGSSITYSLLSAFRQNEPKPHHVNVEGVLDRWSQRKPRAQGSLPLD